MKSFETTVLLAAAATGCIFCTSFMQHIFRWLFCSLLTDPSYLLSTPSFENVKHKIKVTTCGVAQREMGIKHIRSFEICNLIQNIYFIKL